MQRYKTLYSTLAIISFTIIWGIQEKFVSLFPIKGDENTIWWIKTISILGLYAFLFQFLLWISNLIFDNFIADESKITGDWYQVFKIYDIKSSNKDKTTLRHGIVNISYKNQCLEISATNHKLDKSSSPSSWHSDKITIKGKQIWLLFSSTGVGRDINYGNMLFHYHENNPKKLIGQFSNSAPASNYGPIELFRYKNDYEKRLDEILRDINE